MCSTAIFCRCRLSRHWPTVSAEFNTAVMMDMRFIERLLSKGGVGFPQANFFYLAVDHKLVKGPKQAIGQSGPAVQKPAPHPIEQQKHDHRPARQPIDNRLNKLSSNRRVP